MTTVEHLLAQNPVFASLPPAPRATLLDNAIKRHYTKGETIVHAGDDWPYLFIVTEGSVNAQKCSPEGRNLVITTFQKGDIFWGLAFFHPEMLMPVCLEAQRATKIHLWSRETLHPLLQSHGAFSWELARLMVYKMVRASEILEEIAFQPVAGRLAKLLIETSSSSDMGAITRSLTLDEMAARIGSTREMVCRFLHRFADDGVIDITRTEFRITNPRRLTELARNSKG
ncbi:MAG: Crp/Fnr family transcriptional regulator [Anaerolineaceae bacterium]|nr:Crp/Fnr family transcriptional regulator [Anaerolineaceae bacterium]